MHDCAQSRVTIDRLVGAAQQLSSAHDYMPLCVICRLVCVWHGSICCREHFLCMAYLEADPASKVTVLPLMVKRVPAGDFRKNSYLPAMSKKRTPVYLTAKLYFLAAMSALTPLKDKAAACITSTLLAVCCLSQCKSAGICAVLQAYTWLELQG